MYIEEKKNKRTMKIRIKTAVVIVSCFMISGCGMQDSGLIKVNAAGSGQDAETDIEAYYETDSEAEGVADLKADDAVDITPDNRISGEASGRGPAPDDIVSADEPGEVPAADIYVHVCGAVADPGVYVLKSDTRVFEAVEAAGGFTEDAAEDYVNLAMPVSDGMKIVIPTVEELAGIEGTDLSYGVSDVSTEDLKPEPDSLKADGLININTADESELMTLTGIGEGKARAIVSYREEHGSFKSTEELKNVSGIGDATFNKFKDSITVGVK